VLVGYDFTRPISTTDLALVLPNNVEFQQFNPGDIARPEFAQARGTASAPPHRRLRSAR